VLPAGARRAVTETNPYCEALGIPVPRLEVAAKSKEANYYSLLIVALLERGEPITLAEAAKRFEEAGVAAADRALASLKRCRPARPPIYRDGDLYALDPHDHEVDLWAFQLGLRPPKAEPLELVPRETGPLPPLDEPLTVAALDEAWRHGIPGSWSAQRIAICVLDAHGKAMRPDDALAFVQERSEWSMLSAESATYWHRGAPVRVREDGLWEVDREHDLVRSARRAVRERVEMVRSWAGMRPDPAVVAERQERFKKERAANADRLERMRRVLVHAFPAKDPAAVVLLDVGRREIETFLGTEVIKANEKLADYDIIGALDVRALLRALRFAPGERRLAELGPPQKTRRLNKRGRTLKITTKLLVQGSCGISRPFGDKKVMRGYLREGRHTRLRRRLEADAKSLHALYEYGRLHGGVRLRWGFLDEMIPAPWVHRDEEWLYGLMKRALVAFQGENIVAATVNNLGCDLALAASRIDGDDRLVDIDLVQKVRDCRDFIGFFSGCQLPQTDAATSRPGTHEEEWSKLMSPIMRTTQRLTIDGDDLPIGPFLFLGCSVLETFNPPLKATLKSSWLQRRK